MTHCAAADRTDSKPPGNGRREEEGEEGEQKERPDESAMHLRAGVATNAIVRARYPGKRNNARPFRINSRSNGSPIRIDRPARRFFPEAARKFESDNDFELLWKARTALSAVLSFRGSVCLLLQLLRRLAVISRCEFTAEGSRAARDERLNKQTDAKGIGFARE